MTEATITGILDAVSIFMRDAAVGATIMGVTGFLIGGIYLLFIDLPFRVLEIIKGR